MNEKKRSFCYYGAVETERLERVRKRFEKETGRIMENEQAMDLFLDYCVDNMEMLAEEALDNGKIE